MKKKLKKQNTFPQWPSYSKEEIEAVSNVLKTNKVNYWTGNECKEFEKEFSEWINVNYSISLSNGTVALELALMALDIPSFSVISDTKPEFIVTSRSFIASVSSIVNIGAVPVFVDVDPKTLGLDPMSLKAAITKDTKAVVVVHALGFNAITEEIRDILDNANIFVIEDCCESHGALLDASTGQRIGTYGDVSVFSFYFGHHITTIEGGIVSTNNEKLYQLSRMLRSHGMTREASIEVREEYERNLPDLNPLFTFALPGFNFRSTEINAVLGLSQLKKLDRNIEKRTFNLNVWLNALSQNLYKVDYEVRGSSSFALPLILKNPDRDLKDRVCSTLNELDVEYRLGTAGGGNLSRQPFVINSKHRVIDDQKVVNHIHDFGLYIGNGGHVERALIIKLAEALNNL